MKIIAAITLLLITGVADAGWITIDPDDYQPGVPIASEFVQVFSVSDYVEYPISRAPNPYDPNNAVFGGLYTVQLVMNRIKYGLLFDFLAPVDAVQIDVINFEDPQPVGIDCHAFAANGQQISCNGALQFTAPFGGATTASLTFGGDGITKLYLGGGDESALVFFDKLRFNVPEPATLELFAIGLLGVFFFCRRPLRRR